ncbi:hypothetical protein [Sinomonas atrocyanea]|uniref:hypothetical protein n=1 Tax=Sinomonas atrocyanea TaxID=37927 RepID=UPI0028586B9F|nr:hypothetical protein [Sinomonas atrocyanea]MDR6620795.1 small-conductance mechanosensitive channel [Sinomonas atrocyanea]
MSGTTFVDTTTSPETVASASALDAPGARIGSLARADRLVPVAPRVRLTAVMGRLLMVLGALAVVTAYILLPLVAALRAGAVLGGAALALAAVIVVEAALAVVLTVLKTQGRH